MTLDDLKKLPKDAAIAAVAQWAGVDESDIRGIWRVESSSGQDPAAFRPNRDKKSSAFGDFQLTNSTVQGIADLTGVRLDRSNFYDSLWGAGYVLQQNMAAYNGDKALAIGAYKQGRGQVAPRTPEAQAYVAKVGATPIPPDEYTSPEYNTSRVFRELAGAQHLSDDALMNTRAADIRAATRGMKVPKDDAIPAFQKRAAGLAAGAAAIDVLSADPNASAPLDQMEANRQAVLRASPTAVSEALTSNPVPTNFSTEGTEALMTNQYKRDVGDYTAAENLSFGTQAEAAFENQSVIKQLSYMAASNALQQQGDDPSYVFDKDRLDAVRKDPRNFTAQEIHHISDAVSEQDQERIQNDIMSRRQRDEIVAAKGGVSALTSSLLAGIADPVGFVAGFGVGKVAQIAGVAARASILARAGIGAVEGAAANVAITGALQASGGYVTKHDYLMAAIAGAGLGTAGHLWGASKDAVVSKIAKGVQDYNESLATEALRRVGPTADPDAFRAAMRDIENERFAAQQARDNIILHPVGDEQRILPESVGNPADTMENGGFKTAADQALRNDIWERYGIANMSDEAQRQILTETLGRAEGWVKANPIDQKRLTSLITSLRKGGEGGKSVADWLESTGILLARSQNPVAQWVAGNLMEVTTGAAGRNRTASILKSQLEDHAREMYSEVNGYFDLYRNQNKISSVRAFIDPNVRAGFDKKMLEEIQYRRFNPVESDAGRVVDPNVKGAVDAWERAMDRMRMWGKTAKIAGHEALGETSRGYAPQLLDGAKIMEWQAKSSRTIDALQNRFAEKFMAELGMDEPAASKLARDYIQYARTRATGGIDTPGNIRDDDVGGALYDALQKAGVVSEAATGRAARDNAKGGASFTKRRLDIDLNETFTDPVSGKDIPLSDFYVTDMSKLYTRYANRMTGEVALAQYGIYGRQGIQAIRDAMTLGNRPAQANELAAFDDFIGDMIGRGMDGSGLARSISTNVRLLTSMKFLGGMGITQAAELMQMIHILGVDAALKSVPILRQLFSDVRAMKGVDLSKELELYGHYIDADARFQFPSEVQGEYRTYGQDTPGLMSRTIRASAYGFQKLSAHRAIHRWQMKMATEQIASRVLRDVNSGTELGKFVKDMGFDDKTVAMIKEDLPNVATFDAQGRVKDLDLSKTKNPEAMSRFVTSVRRGANQIIQGTFRGEKGRYANNVLGQILTQFRTFSLISAEKGMARTLGLAGPTVGAMYIIGQMMMSLPLQIARVQLAAQGLDGQKRKKYLEENMSPIALARASMNYSSLTGILDVPTDLAMGVGGAFGVPVGENAKLGTRGIAGVLPTLGYADGAYQGTSRFLYNPTAQNAVKAGRAWLPGSNLPYLTPFLNMLSQ